MSVEQSAMNRFWHESTTIKNAPPHNLPKFNGKIYLLVYVLTMFWYGERACLCFAQDEIEVHLVQCVEQKDADSDENTKKPEWDQIGLCSYTPMLHPAVCAGKESVVTLNDIHLLGQPVIREFLITWKFSQVGYGKAIPVCLTKNIVLEGCLRMFPKLIMEHNQKVLILKGDCFLKVIGLIILFLSQVFLHA